MEKIYLPFLAQAGKRLIAALWHADLEKALPEPAKVLQIVSILSLKQPATVSLAAEIVVKQPVPNMPVVLGVAGYP